MKSLSVEPPKRLAFTGSYPIPELRGPGARRESPSRSLEKAWAVVLGRLRERFGHGSVDWSER